MDWNTISTQPNLTENFIREHADQLDWIAICSSKELSLDFMKEMSEYIFLNLLRYRLQKGILRHIDQNSFAELEAAYLSHWMNHITISRHTLHHPNERQYYNPNPKSNVQLFFQLHEDFNPVCHTHLDLSIIFDVEDFLPSSKWSVQGFSIAASTFQRNLSISDFFTTGQQKDAFFHLINHYLLDQQIIQTPISFYHKF